MRTVFSDDLSAIDHMSAVEHRSRWRWLPWLMPVVLVGWVAFYALVPPSPPHVGDRRHVSFTIDPCGYVATGWRGYSAGAHRLGLRYDHGSAVLIITELSVDGSEGFEGTLVTDRGDRIHVFGAPTKQFFGNQDSCIPS